MDNSMQKVHEVLDKEWRLSVRLITEECRIPKTIVRVLTKDLLMRKVCENGAKSPDE